MYYKFKQAKKIAIISHARPDADAFGSTVALGLALESQGKEITLLNDDDMPERYLALTSKKFHKPSQFNSTDFDLIISVDAATHAGMGSVASFWPIDINIDHHLANGNYAKLNLVRPSYIANCLHILQIIDDLKCPITTEMANVLYLGIVGDTGNFRYPGVDVDTFEAAARLVRYGANPSLLSDIESKIPSNVFSECNDLLSERLEWIGKRIAFLSIPNATYTSFYGDHVQLKKQLLERMFSVDSIDLVCLLTWITPTHVIGSLRTKEPYDVNTFAKENFGGGGHKLAAGFQIKDVQNHSQFEIDMINKLIKLKNA